MEQLDERLRRQPRDHGHGAGHQARRALGLAGEHPVAIAVAAISRVGMISTVGMVMVGIDIIVGIAATVDTISGLGIFMLLPVTREQASCASTRMEMPIHNFRFCFLISFSSLLSNYHIIVAKKKGRM